MRIVLWSRNFSSTCLKREPVIQRAPAGRDGDRRPLHGKARGPGVLMFFVYIHIIRTITRASKVVVSSVLFLFLTSLLFAVVAVVVVVIAVAVAVAVAVAAVVIAAVVVVDDAVVDAVVDAAATVLPLLLLLL